MRQAGADAYDKLFSKDGDWTDPTVTDGHQHHARGPQRQVRRRRHRAALGTAFTDGIGAAFRKSAEGRDVLRGRLRRRHRARRDLTRTSRSATDIDFFDFPIDQRRGRDHDRWRRARRLHGQAGREGVHDLHDDGRSRHRLGQGRAPSSRRSRGSTRASTRTTSRRRKRRRLRARLQSASTAPTSCRPAPTWVPCSRERSRAGREGPALRLPVDRDRRLGGRVPEADARRGERLPVSPRPLFTREEAWRWPQDNRMPWRHRRFERAGDHAGWAAGVRQACSSWDRRWSCSPSSWSIRSSTRSYLSFYGGLGFDAGQLRFVGLDNYIKLLTTDKAFLNLHFPPAGALFNNVLWLILSYTRRRPHRAVIAVIAARVRYESFDQGGRLPADGDRGHGPRRDLGLRLRARPVTSAS